MPARLSLSRLLAQSARSLARILRSILDQPPSGLRHDAYLRRVLAALHAEPGRSWRLRVAAGELGAVLDTETAPDHALHYAITRFQEELARAAGEDPGPAVWRDPGAGADRAANGDQAADADLAEKRGDQSPASGSAGWHPGPAAVRLPVVIWLPHLRSPFNVGNILRSAAAFGIAGVVLGPACPDLEHPRLRRAAMGAAELLPIVRGDRYAAEALLASTVGRTGEPGGASPARIVLETGGIPVHTYPFPPAGLLICGHEERGVDPEMVREAAAEERLVGIPHYGAKQSLNVGVAAGIVLAAWQQRLESRLRD